MAKQGTILVVDDNKGILTAVQMLLGTCFEKVITISTPNKIKNTLHDENVDVVLLDMNFSAGINSGQWTYLRSRLIENLPISIIPGLIGQICSNLLGFR